MYVEVGDHVSVGELIGLTNNTGYSSGNHLHYEVQPMDKDAGGHPILTFADPAAYPKGVIAGAIDPVPFFTGMYAKDVPHEISLSQQLVVLLKKLIDAINKKQNG
jgi:murein DD-endopeptidase MepM/ murein hydrolase activator NlpD